jgi:uncharacterized protein (TIGR00288 family)
MEITKEPIPTVASIRDEAKIALFMDFENIALGVREAKYKSFEILKVTERLVEKGKIVYKKAYADWEDYGKYKKPFHEAAIELVEVPRSHYSGKNSADIRMVVDALDLCYSKEHINVFAVMSGDSDFSPLVSKLKENNKYVIGIGVKNSTSDLLIENCDEFIFYEDLVREASSPTQSGQKVRDLPKKQREAFERIMDAIKALLRENKEVIWGSMIKQTIKRKHPEFNEEYHGYRSFSHLLEDAQAHELLLLKKDARSGSYVVSLKE